MRSISDSPTILSQSNENHPKLDWSLRGARKHGLRRKETRRGERQKGKCDGSSWFTQQYEWELRQGIRKSGADSGRQTELTLQERKEKRGGEEV